MIRSSTALRRVRQRLEKQPGFVCLLLLYCEGSTTQVSHDLEKFFPSGGAITSWLLDNCPEFVDFCEQATDAELAEALHAYRKAWVDQMILDYLAKGD